MEDVGEGLWSLLHKPEGPLVPYLGKFARSIDEQGFNRKYLGAQLRWTAKFSKWLQAEQISAGDVTEEHVQRFLEGAITQQQGSTRRSGPAILKRFTDLLGQLGVISPRIPHHDCSPIAQAVDAYSAYLKQEQGLSDRTLVQYCPFVEHFLVGRFGHGEVEFALLGACDVIRFVKHQAVQLSPARAKAATIALRSFFRYLRVRGEIQLDLVAAVPTIPNWSMTGIPRAIAPEHIRAILAQCPRDNPVGRRDYAILLLLARLGLRACEIVSLTLDSIDWEAGSIVVIGKGKQVASLPLPIEVGDAIATYLRQDRPACHQRALFLRACAPVRGLGAASTIGTIVNTAISRAGIDVLHRGTHQFRHALATDMLRQGATLTEIGSVLRHRHVKTTGIYAKVDFAALRPLSLPWPGAAQ
jgi:integrase/recombinase XerD